MTRWWLNHVFFPESPILLRNGSNLTKNNQLGGKKKQLDLVPISVGFPIQYLLGFVFQMYFSRKGGAFQS